MVEEQENSFLLMVIRDLINLCEITKGDDNRAVISSNIMFCLVFKKMVDLASGKQEMTPKYNLLRKLSKIWKLLECVN